MVGGRRRGRLALCGSTKAMSETPEGEILKAHSPADQVRVGMGVASMDGESLGSVKEIRETELLLNRPLARDLWVPLEAVMATEEFRTNYRGGATQPEQVVLNVTAAHIDRQGWRHA